MTYYEPSPSSIFKTDCLYLCVFYNCNNPLAGRSSPTLLKAYLTVIPNGECGLHYRTEESLPHGITETQICAKDPENLRDTCQGDSGGPLILHSNDQYGIKRSYAIGITSFGKPCGFNVPAVYTRVSEYIEWIEKIVWP
uniref:Peptidase S1 domain-containing protein n=1 Tax=Glossina morsitans morsitans TaxID=37546 RepID=A0A1B0GBT7_GLOMM